MAAKWKLLRQVLFDIWIPYLITGIMFGAAFLIMSIFQSPGRSEHFWFLAKLFLLAPVVVGTVHSAWHVFLVYARTHD